MALMIRFFGIIFRFVLLLSPLTLTAMEVSVSGSVVTMSGPVVMGDFTRLKDALAMHSDITTVLLRNSNGGHASTGYRIGELIRDKGLLTVVSGHCISSCSRMFLGGKERRFSDDQDLRRTYVAFHGHYDDSGQLNRQSVQRLGLYNWIVKYSDGKADNELVQRWINIEYNRGMVAFLHPEAKIAGEKRTFICDGREHRRPLGCEGLQAKALELGVITDLAIWRSTETP
jgi:hypothetical protein